MTAASMLDGAGVRAIALDLPGHGDALVPADRAVAPWTDVLDTLDHLGVNRRSNTAVIARYTGDPVRPWQSSASMISRTRTGRDAAPPHVRATKGVPVRWRTAR
ncbi:hypothetical protein ACIO3R_24995 [Streptomyces sp. NPDC087428]|uniref:hypothetical protein n=1 Tax=Streptomyces sp. NPDC087428 TaxID=3365788 RepID=UPI003830536D